MSRLKTSLGQGLYEFLARIPLALQSQYDVVRGAGLTRQLLQEVKVWVLL